MRFHYIIVLGALLVTAPVTCAQEFPRWEAFGGFSYGNVGLGPQAEQFSPTSANYYGFGLDFSFNPHRNVRLLADVNFQWGGTAATPPPPFTKIRLQNTEALFGPQFTLRKPRATPFANVLVGVTNTRLQGQAGLIYEDLIYQNDLTLAFGGGLDVNWTRFIAVRAFQVEVVPTLRSGNWEMTYTVNTGLVFKFGFR